MEQGIATLTPPLIVAWTLVAVGFSALAILAYVAVRNRTRQVDLEKATQTFHSLDIEAFRNLIDSSEEEFLRNNLPPRKFRKVKRQRAWAALLYAWEAGGAATALAQVGQNAQRSSDPRIAASGVQLAESAFQLRLHIISAGMHLITTILLPDLRSRALPTFVDQYERAAVALAFCKPSLR